MIKLTYHHTGIPTSGNLPEKDYIPALKLYASGFSESTYGIEWMKFDDDCPVPELVKTVPHVAFVVDKLSEALKGKEILIEPNSPSEGVMVAFIVDNGAPVELMEFQKKENHLKSDSQRTNSLTLKNDGVVLRKFRKSDAPRLVELANNEKISRNLTDAFPCPYTLPDAENFLSKILDQGIPAVFAIEYNGEYVGNIGLHERQDVYRKTADIGYFLGEPYWNKGIMTIAVNLITNYGFSKLGLARIQTGIFEYNIPSMKVLEKCGFLKEGVFRKSVYKLNRLWDEIRYAKINPALHPG